MRAGRAARVDGNQGEIVRALRDAGAFVQSLATIGDGCPDLLVIHDGLVFVFELKDPAQPERGLELSDDEKDWHYAARVLGHYDVPVIETARQALEAIGVSIS